MLFRNPSGSLRKCEEVKNIVKTILKDMQDSLVCKNDYITEDLLPFFNMENAFDNEKIYIEKLEEQKA